MFPVMVASQIFTCIDTPDSSWKSLLDVLHCRVTALNK